MEALPERIARMILEAEGVGVRDPAWERKMERLEAHPAWQEKYREFMPKVWAAMSRLHVLGGVRDAVSFARSLPGVEAVEFFPPLPGLRDSRQPLGICQKGEDGRSVIWLNAALRGTRGVEFTACHEAAHHLFHPPGNYAGGWKDSRLKDIYDIQANWAASELKMPTARFVPYCVSHNFDPLAIAARFNVSESAASLRAARLTAQLRHRGLLPNRCLSCGKTLLPGVAACPDCGGRTRLAAAGYLPRPGRP